MEKIMVIIDAQNDFITGPLGSKEAEVAAANICNLLKIANPNEHIFLTRDSHTYQYLESREGKNLPIEHCITETPGWCIESKIDREICSQSFKFVNFINKNTFGALDLPLEILESYEKKFLGYLR